MSKFDARDYIRRKYSGEKEELGASLSKTSDGGFDARRRIKEKYIDFYTFSDDLNAMSNTINGIYGGWQDAETMASTKSKVEGMYNRLLDYEDYRKSYGDEGYTDLSKLVSGYEGVLGEWDTLAESYGKYASADEFNAAVEASRMKEEAEAKRRQEMLSADVDALQTEISDLEGVLSEARRYANAARDVESNQRQGELRSRGLYTADSGKIDSAHKELSDYLESVGYTSIDELTKTITEKKDFAKQASFVQNGAQMASVADPESENYDKDFAEKSKYIPLEGIYLLTDAKRIYEFINADEDERADIINSAESSADAAVIAFKDIFENEIALYNYYFNNFGEKKALEYLDTIALDLESRFAEGRNEALKKFASSHPVISSAYSVTGNVIGAPGEYIKDQAFYYKTGMMSRNLNADVATTIRGTVSEETDIMLGNWDAFDFVYNTTMSGIDSVAAATLYGKAGGAALGLSSAASATNDALNRGFSNRQAAMQGYMSGAFEMLFETISIGRFLDEDVSKGMLKNLASSMFVNATEEMATELANIAYDTYANGDLSNYALRVQELVDSGMSEEEAKSKAKWELAGQVVEAGASGALMGGGFTAVNTAAYNIDRYFDNKNLGKTIRANEKVGDVFDMASLSPEESSAYEAYTKYADKKKAVTAETARDSQVGNLATKLKADALSVLADENATEEQRERAKKVLVDLKSYSQNKSISRLGKGKVKKVYGDAEHIEAIIAEGLESGEGTKAYELATKYKAKVDSGKKLSAAEITSLVDATDAAVKSKTEKAVAERLTELGEKGDVEKLADIIARKESGELLTSAEQKMLEESEFGSRVAEEVTASEELSEASVGLSEEEATLFRENYSGGDVENYRASFDLVLGLARNNYGADYILENRGVLSPRQVQNIYSKVVTEPRAASQRALDGLVSKYEGRLTYKSKVDDSIFKGVKGKKLWKSLNKRQKQAITFAKAFAKGAGINLKITYGEKYNGYYDPATNSIVIDARAGFDKRYIGEDAIIPTLSHELTHWMKNKSPELYAELSRKIFGIFKDKGLSEGGLIEAERRKHPEYTDDQARDEIIARACEDLFAMSEEGRKIFDSLSENEQKTLTEKIKEIIKNLVDWVNELLGLYESKSEEAKALRGYKDGLAEVAKIWDETLVSAVRVNAAMEMSEAGVPIDYEGTPMYRSAQERRKIKGEGVQYSSKDGEIKKAEELSETDFRFLLEQTQYGVLDDDSYIPMRISTPEFFRDVVYEHSEGKITVMDTPLASQVEHLRQNMEEDDDTSYGESRPHNLSIDDIVTISEEMGHPAYIVLQKNGRYAMVVSFYNSRKKKVVVSIDFARDKEPINNYKYRQYMNGYNEGYYNIIVTQFEPDDFEHYLNGCEIVYDKKKMNGRYQVGSGRVVTFTHDTPFIDDSLSHPDGEINNEIVNNEGIQKSEKDYGRITADMSDAERTRILSGKSIVAPIYEGQADSLIEANSDDLNSKISTIKNAIVRIGEEFGVIGNEIRIDDVEVVITPSRKNLKETLSKETTPTELAKLLPILKESVSKAIGVERHDNRYYFDSDTVYFENLLGGYVDGKEFVPVRFGLKHSKTGNTVLYVVVDQNRIPLDVLEQKNKTEVVNTAGPIKTDQTVSRSVEYSISQIIPFVKSKDLLRYIPDGMLDVEQKTAKWEAIADTIIYTNDKNDKHYADFIRKGNEMAAKEMVTQAAKVNGYTRKMFHETNAENIHIFDISMNTHGETDSETPYGIFTKSSDKNIGLGSRQMALFVKAERTLNVANRQDVKNKIPELLPYYDEIARIDREYDALMEELEDAEMDALDNWLDEHPEVDMDDVYPNEYIAEGKPADIDSQEYLEAHNAYKNAMEEWKQKYAKVAVKCKEIITSYLRDNNYDSMYFEVDGGSRGRQTDSLILLDKNQVKSADTITYDDNDNIIPISQRFNSEKNDIRFSEKDTGTSAYDIMGKQKELEKRYKILEKDFARLKEMYKLDKRLTHGKVFDPKQVEAVARYLVKYADSDYKASELAPILNDLYVDLREMVTDNPDATWDMLYSKAYEVAKEIRTKAKVKVERPAYFEKILKEIRSARIAPNEGQKGDAKHRFGDHYVGKFRGRVTISNDGTPLDIKWAEWAAKYPDVFDKDIGDAQQLVELYDIYDELRNAADVVVEYEESEMLSSLANEIINKAWMVDTFESMADKREKRMKELRAEHRKAMEEMRETYKQKESDRKLLDKMYYGRLLAETRRKRKEDVAEAKRLGRERLAAYRENAERKRVIGVITSDCLKLNKMLVTNSNDLHIHEALKGPVMELLDAIDFSSRRLLEKGVPTKKDISLEAALAKVKDMMAKASAGDFDLVQLYGHNLDADIEAMMESVANIRRSFADNEFVLQRMSLDDLVTLRKMVKTIKSAVNKLNEFHIVQHTKGIAHLSQESIEYLDSLGKGKVFDGIRGKLDKTMVWNNTLPYYAFKRYGEGGALVYEALMDGWDRFAFNIDEIMRFTQSVYTDKEVETWDNEVKTFKIAVPATATQLADSKYTPKIQEVQMTVSQIMSIYCLQKRAQAQKHLLEGGIRIENFKKKNGEIVSQEDGAVITEKDIETIISSLSARQMAVADKLQEFMNTVCSDWGNEVSMARFGIKQFGEEHYFPLKSDDDNLSLDEAREEGDSFFKLLGASFAKPLIKGANNRIVISGVFDVFAKHTSDMAKYNALALPVLDAFRWYNYKGKVAAGSDGAFISYSLKQSMKRAFGDDGLKYFTQFLKDINGTKTVSRDTIGGGFIKNDKIASVGANLRVIFLQPTSYVRASAVIDNKYLTKALAFKDKARGKAADMAEKYCGIALWKSLGYYDTNVQQGVTEQIKHKKNWHDKATDLSMKGASMADRLTWGLLWNACELEIRDTRKDLKVGSEEFYKATGKRLREVIYATQVVDSTMTRSQMMRGGDRLDKLTTSFMSEPTLAYNMVLDAVMDVRLEARRSSFKDAWEKHGAKVARTAYAYTMTNALAALVETAFDAYRDDDDEEKELLDYVKMYFANFVQDMGIIGKIPVLKDLISIIRGYGASYSILAGFEGLFTAVKQWWKIFTSDKGNSATALKNTLKALSSISGLPIYNVYRDAAAGLDKFFGVDIEELLNDLID